MTTNTSPIFNGSTVQIVFRHHSTGDVEIFYFDNITVTGTGSEGIDVTATVDGVLSCANNSVTIIGNPAGADYTYSWTGPNSFSANTKDITVSTAGDYTLTVSSPDECSGSATATVDYSSDDDIEVTAIVDGVLSCGNNSVTITGNPAGVDYTYSWTGPNSFTASTKDITVSTLGDYTLTVTSTNDCSGSTTVTVISGGGGSGTVWLEDFAGLANGTKVDEGTTAWTIEYPGAGYADVQSERFMSGNLDVEAIWRSEVIDISAYSDVNISFDLQGEGSLDSDEYFDAYYILDGGSETLFFDYNFNNEYPLTTNTSPIFSGSTVQIVFRHHSTGEVEIFYFDNITVTGIGSDGIDVTATVDGVLSCANSTVTISGSPAGDDYAYHWTGPNGFTANTKDIIVSTAGEYTLSVTSSDGCSGSATAMVTSSNGTSGVIWLEDFEDLDNGTKVDNGSTSWSIDDSGLNTGWMEVQNHRFVTHGSDIDWEIGRGIWMSEVIDISSSTDVELSVDIDGEGTLDDSYLIDSLEIYYKLDGGPETPFINGIIVGNFEPTTIFSPTINGNTVQIIIRSKSTGDSEYYYYDNITVSGSGSQTSIIANATVDGLITCNDESTILRGSSNIDGVTYRWTGPNGFSSSLQNPVVADSGMFVLIVEGDADCATSDTVSIRVLADTTNPDVSINKDGDITCINPLVTLQGSSITEGVEYAWSGPGSYSSTDQNIEISDSGTYFLTVEKTISGCTGTESIVVESNEQIPVIAIMGSGKLNCINDMVGLIAISSTDSATFTWSGPNGFNDTGKEVFVEVDGTYSLVVLDTTNGCEANVDSNVEIDTTSPGVNILPTSSLTCSNHSVLLAGESFTPNTIFKWTGPEGYQSNEKVSSTTVPGNYTLTVTNLTNGCIAHDYQDVVIDTVSPQDVETSVSGEFSCKLNSVTLSGLSSTDGVIYNWTGPAEFSEEEQEVVVYNPGYYVFTVTNPVNGCTESIDVFVEKSKSPVINPHASVSGILTCIDSVVTLHGSSDISSATYKWINTDGFSSSDKDSEVKIPGEYTLIVTDPDSDCSEETSIVVKQDIDFPSDVEFMVSDTLDCNTGSVVLSATSGEIDNVYEWRNPDGLLLSNNPTAIAVVPGLHTLIVINNFNGCVIVEDVEVIEEECP